MTVVMQYPVLKANKLKYKENRMFHQNSGNMCIYTLLWLAMILKVIHYENNISIKITVCLSSQHN